MKKLLCPFILVLAFLAAPAAARADYYFITLLAGANEVPPTDSPGAGVGLVILSDDLSTMTVIEVWDDLTGPAIAAHIHVGAPDVSGPVILPFSGFPSASDGFYTTDLTADDFTDSLCHASSIPDRNKPIIVRYGHHVPKLKQIYRVWE